MWVKVCGIRDCETANQLAELGVDAIGLNFYSGSPRVVGFDDAIKISQTLPKEVVRVGVFVNHSIDEIEITASRCRLDMLQLHGDEPPAFVGELQRRLPHLRIIRAWRMGNDRLGDLETYLKECRSLKCELAACLVDAHVAGLYGGSGKTVPWEQLALAYQFENWPPLILAGGLNASNVSLAIKSARPWGVDVASGVESSPGVKEIELVRQFLWNARNAK